MNKNCTSWILVYGFLLLTMNSIAFAYKTVEVKPLEKNTEVHTHRLWHFVLRSVAMKDALWMVDTAKKYGFNAVVIQVTDGVSLTTSPWIPREDAWSKDEFIYWVDYAKKHGMDVIPEVKLLSHQEKFLQNNRPELMFNSVTYNPDNPDVYNVVFPFLDEIIDIINPIGIHIGHDEVVGYKRKKGNFSKNDDIPIPASLFLKDVINVYTYLKSKGVGTAIWGDMLLSSDEFPNMSKKYLNGNAFGYGKQLRDKIPKDIVIFDWHYIDNLSFRSMSVLRSEGFKVIATTWKKESTIKKFSQHSKKEGASAIMASLWFYVQREEWDLVETILKFSSREFVTN